MIDVIKQGFIYFAFQLIPFTLYNTDFFSLVQSRSILYSLVFHTEVKIQKYSEIRV